MLLKLIAKLIIGIIDKVIPAKKNRYTFYITTGTHWDANLQCLFAYICSYPDTECCVIYNHSTSKTNTPKEKRLSTIQGMAYLLTSKTILFDHAVPPGIRAGKHTMVNVWHGIPIKTIRFFDKNSFSPGYLENQSKNTSLLIASSKTDKLAMSASFQIDPDRVQITGLPRNDLLSNPQKFNNRLSTLSDEQKKLKAIINKKRLILYAPTYRGDSHNSSSFINPSKKFELQLERILKENNAVLGVRPHKFSPPIEFEHLSNASLVLDLSSEIISNTSILLTFTDILITDFSSIWVDFLLTQKPIIGYIPDKSQYIEERDCLYDFQCIFPGEEATTESELITCIEQALKNKFIPNSKYTHITETFHTHTDGKNTERVFEEIKRLM